ncbi:translation initiation factor IF-2 [Vicingus serpentipes]|uniref:Translation initiation factor IF-2 n=1 Tax=Vicingus serpentipes TaxID=1926625 RepID=A0A5C6RZ58_9FLAO|nr:translation initiation factor IF-2 [Vicingus serpentipes]TXB67245.1 translation initiation factor IF-2 [Vicingus serpentipes]
MAEGATVKRLSKVAREFNVGINTLVEYLASKGVQVESNPNTKIDGETYNILVGEFQSEKSAKEESKKVSIGTEKETISIEPIESVVEPKVESPKEESPATSEKGKDEEIKVVGKIDLSTLNLKTRPDKKPKQKEEPKVEAPKKEEPKVEKAVNKTEEKPIEKIEEKPEAAPKREEIETVYEKLSAPKVLGKIELPVNKPKTKAKPVASSEGGADASKKKRKRLPRKVDVATNANKNTGRTPFKKGGGRVEKKEELTEQQIQDQIKETLAKLTGGGKSKASKHRRDKRQAASEQNEMAAEIQEAEKRLLKITEFVTVSEIASMMDVGVNDIIGACMSLGLFVSINQRLDAETLSIIAEEYGFFVEFVSATEESEAVLDSEDNEEDLVERSPIVTVMGHVDHGKTSLLDYIREANVIGGEAGGITQHIGAYSVGLKSGKKVAFLDTPGHEAFTAMRARGAQVTDVVIIVIAADDSVMPQTKEAINHAQAAGVPIVFAFNKIDKPGANADKVREELSTMNILVEDWGGKYQAQEVSAKTGQGIEDLLEKVALEAEMLDLKANPNKNGVGTVIESELDKGRGYVSTILVQAGTMKIGDILLAGCYSGRVKAMFNERGQKVEEAGPSTPVSILGLNGAPNAGDKFHVMDDEKEARSIAERRLQLQREQGVRTQKHITLDEIGRRLAIGDFKELNVILKGDVDGSIEALSDSLQKLSTEQIQVNIIHKSVGQISESDVMLAAASEAIIIGFQVRPSVGARKTAEKEQIDIRLYSIIYDAIEEVKDAMEGMLAPKVEEKIVGTVEIREVFKISKVGTIAGCMVQEGKVFRNSKVRLIRDGIVIFDGLLGSLKRFKDDVKEVAKGYECGLNIANYNDIKVDDIVEAYELVEIKQKLK